MDSTDSAPQSYRTQLAASPTTIQQSCDVGRQDEARDWFGEQGITLTSFKLFAKNMKDEFLLGSITNTVLKKKCGAWTHS